MKKSIILSSIVFILFCTLQVNAQEKAKKVTDTTQACKPTKSGKHCTAPTKKGKH